MQTTVKLIASDADFLVARGPWSELSQRIEQHNVFNSWEWAYTWWQSYKSKMKSCSLFVIFVYHGDSLIGIVPAYRQTVLGRFRMLRLLGDRFETSLYSDFLVDSDWHEPFAKALASVLRQNRILFIQGTGVSPESHLQRFGRLRYRISQPQFDCAYVPLPTQFSTYLQQRRRNVQKDRKRLFGEFGARRIDLTSQGRKSLETLFDLHERGFQLRGEETRFRKEVRLEFHANLWELLEPAKRVYLLGVEHEGKVVAMSYGFRHGDTSVGYQLGYDPGYRRLGIGFQLILNEIEWAIENDLIEHDLSAGAASYKSVFCEESRSVYRVFVGCSATGNMMLRLFNCYISARKRAVSAIRCLKRTFLRRKSNKSQ